MGRKWGKGREREEKGFIRGGRENKRDGGREGGMVGGRRRASMNAKTAADKNGSLGVGSEKQTRHQAKGSVSLATNGLGEGSGVGWGGHVVSVYVCCLHSTP